MQAKQQTEFTFSDQLEIATRVVHALANPARVALVRFLWQEGTLNVTELSVRLGLDQSTVSSHLRLLHDARLVTRERQERFTLYSIESTRLERVLVAIGRLNAEYPEESKRPTKGTPQRR